MEFLAVSLPYLLLLIYFSSIAKNPFGAGFGNTWSIYKLVQYYFVILAVFLFLFFAYVLNEENRIAYLLGRCFLIGYICISMANNNYYSKKLSQEMIGYVGNPINSVEEYFLLGKNIGMNKKQ